MRYANLIVFTLAAVAIPATAQNNPAQYYDANGTLAYAPYNGYPAFGTYDPRADPFYDAHAACNSKVMQQNGWTIVRQTSPTQCDWQKAKTSNPQYNEWLQRKQQEEYARQQRLQQQELARQQRQQQYAQMQQQMQQRANDIRQDPGAFQPQYVPTPAPVYQPAPQQQTLQQRLGTPSWMPVPNVPAQAVPSWFPTWQQYRNNTNPSGGLNDIGRRRGTR